MPRRGRGAALPARRAAAGAPHGHMDRGGAAFYAGQ